MCQLRPDCSRVLFVEACAALCCVLISAMLILLGTGLMLALVVKAKFSVFIGLLGLGNAKFSLSHVTRQIASIFLP